ncbi:MAG TPA: tetratricopeptide repeat protein [Blastocatellia bacterium]
MKEKDDDEKMLRAYLLGQLPEADQPAIEERMFIDDIYFERLEMAEDELIDEYVEGVLPEADRAAFESHFLAAPQRQKKLRLSLAMHKAAKRRGASGNVGVEPSDPDPVDPPEAEQSGSDLGALAGSRPVGAGSRATNRPAFRRFFASPSFKIAASFIVVAAVGFTVYKITAPPSDLDHGLALMADLYKNGRPIEPRLSDFNYAHLEQNRGPNQTSSDQQVRVDHVRALLKEAVRENPDAQSKHALGEFYLSQRKLDDAVSNLEDAMKLSDKNAKYHSDLGAAYLERAQIEESEAPPAGTTTSVSPGSEWFTKSLNEFDQALQLDPNLVEALFNRALCEKEMGEPDKAKDDWNLYLQKDPNSQWAGEARSNLK